MARIVRTGIVAGAVLIVLVGAAYVFRTPLLLKAIELAGAPPLVDQEKVLLGEQEVWADDFYTVERLDAQTFAISEPRYFRDVYSYLVVGEREALLIDSGSPLRDISSIVGQLTNKPVSVIATHLHFDHVGNHTRFEKILMPDLGTLRARTREGRFVPEALEHLGQVEGYEISGWEVGGWWPVGTEIDLGRRAVTLLATPGHTPDSISIWDRANNRLFMGDYAGDGEIYAFLPNSSLGAYLETTERLLNDLPPETLLFAAHGGAETKAVPSVGTQNLMDLRDGLLAMRDGRLAGTGFWPRAYPINRNTHVLADWTGPGGSSWDFD
ncbi:MBL fold metallo-hydrolase [Parvibaculaceae bacterium PLY_AMNH_Bact1]|nr:MBL fold metallo-hydrolase [Parvibaculaceae bacterium PLY_AMNH_Bact1]